MLRGVEDDTCGKGNNAGKCEAFDRWLIHGAMGVLLNSLFINRWLDSRVETGSSNCPPVTRWVGEGG
jgi:hypothetical protein